MDPGSATGHRGSDEEVFDQPAEHGEDLGARQVFVGADRLDGVEVEAPNEHRQPSEQAALVLEEQLIAPVDDGPQGLLAGQGRASTPGAYPEGVVEAFREGKQRQCTEAGGGELDGEGKAVQPAAEIFDGLACGPIGHKPGLHCTGPLHEELDGGRQTQTSHRHHNLAWNAERFPARGDQPEAWHRSHQVVCRTRPPRR